jgi:hypothetical protein
MSRLSKQFEYGFEEKVKSCYFYNVNTEPEHLKLFLQGVGIRKTSYEILTIIAMVIVPYNLSDKVSLS